MEERTTTITLKRLGALLKTENLMQAMEAAGVDNWVGCGEIEDTEPYEDAVDAAIANGTLTPDGPPDEG